MSIAPPRGHVTTPPGLRAGDIVRVTAHRADGSWYRAWPGTVEDVAPGLLVTVSPPGTQVEDLHGGHIGLSAVRAYYWTERQYNLLEVYEPNGALELLYVHISSSARIEGTQVHYTDHELDVVAQAGQAARIVDEDEFAEAAKRYGYSVAFQREIHRAAEEAMRVASEWKPRGIPLFK